MDKYDKYGPPAGDIWPAPVPDMPKIISLDVKCEKNLMKVYIGEKHLDYVFKIDKDIQTEKIIFSMCFEINEIISIKFN